ncbi:MAG: hypothetical protein ACR2OC_10225 [Solirubrobacterales bacterium]
MINSLRLQGHREPVYVLDLGMTSAQRGLLARDANFVDGPDGVAPWLAKTIAPLAHPAEVMVLIDADMVLTRSLSDPIELAAEGRVVAFENQIDRFVPEWGEILGLGELRRRPYAGSGLVLLGGEAGAEALRLLDERQRRVEMERTFYGRNERDYPFIYPEQDVLNAVIQTRDEPESVEILEYRLAPAQPFDGLELDDLGALRCVYPDGREPYVVHHILPEKPWLEPMYDGIYSRLLKRLLVGPDLAIVVPSTMLPLRMRRGPLARLERLRVDISVKLRWHLGIALHKLRTRGHEAT